MKRERGNLRKEKYNLPRRKNVRKGNEAKNVHRWKKMLNMRKRVREWEEKERNEKRVQVTKQFDKPRLPTST